jgi:predicted AlkP superfamily pyrophosphatase or phosphodiesterase
MPGLRDQHSGCVGAYMVEHELFDFLLLSFPDNDTHSHRFGPHAQVQSIHEADRQLERVMHAGGGPEAFLDEHAVVVMADHSHAAVEQRIDLFGALDQFDLTGPSAAKPKDGEIAVCPAQRSAMVYVLVPEARDQLMPRLLETCLRTDGVDLVIHREEGVAVIMRGDRALAFAPGEETSDVRDGEWVLRGDLGVLDGRVEDGVFRSDTYPDALAGVWSALECPTSGDILL